MFGKNIFHFSDFFLDKIDFNLDKIDFNLDKIDFNLDKICLNTMKSLSNLAITEVANQLFS